MEINMKENSLLKTNRVIYFDLLRIIATFMIVAIHCIPHSSSDSTLFDWSVLAIYDSVTRWGVPVFVMISGALFLGKELSVNTLLKKNILRILSAFLFWSFLYNVLEMMEKGEVLSAKYFFINIIQGHYHMWFLYMIACIYLIVPMLNVIIKHIKLAYYFAALSFVFAFLIPQIITIIGLKSNYLGEGLNEVFSYTHMNFVLGFSGYFVLGYLLHKLQINKKLEILTYIIGIFSLLFTIAVTVWISMREKVLSELFFDSMTINILMMSISVFVFAKQHLNKNFKREHTIDFVSYISKCTFGVYLVHPLVIDCLNKFFGVTTNFFNPILSIPAIALLVFACSLGISAGLNKIPFVKKWFV